MSETRVLLVEDTGSDAELIGAYIRSDNRFSLRHVETLDAACECLRASQQVDVVILDLNLPDSKGLETFRTLRAQYLELPVVILSGQDDEQLAITAVSQGAQDYVPKADLTAPLLVRSVLYAIERNGRQLAERRNFLMELDLATARQIQQHLLPDEPPHIDGFDIAFTYQPSEACSGDFLDFIPIEPRTGSARECSQSAWDLIVADVSSHGFGPALIMVGARRMLRTCAHLYSDLGSILSITNHAVAEDTLEDQFITLFYARLDPLERTLTYSSAGHPAWVVDSRGTPRILEYSGLPLGLLEDNIYMTDGTLSLERGELLMLMTDGAFEAVAPGGEQFGQDRVFEVVRQHLDRSSEEILDFLLAEIKRFCYPELPRDDVAVVLVKVVG